MKKYLISLFVMSLLVTAGWSLAETLQQSQILIESNKFGEFKEVGSEAPLPILETEAASPQTKMTNPYLDESASQIETRPITEKCGVNTFKMEMECGIGAFKYIHFQCHDGYEERHGGENSCKSSGDWEAYAKKICLDRCGAIREPVSEEKSLSEAKKEVSAEPMEISICYMSDRLIDEYNGLLLKLEAAKIAGNTVEAEEIKEKIITLKEKITQSQDECNAGVQPPQLPTETEETYRPTEPVVIDRCVDVNHMQEKLDYYKKLSDLSNEEIMEQTGFPKSELGIEEVVKELTENISKAREQCRLQGEAARLEPITKIEEIQAVVAEPINPVVVESGQEIDTYYRAKIERITAVADVDEQIQSLKSLREEIDVLIERLIKSRKEVEVEELGNVVSEIKLTKGEIKADEVVVKTTAKKMLMSVGEKPISLEPTENEVMIKDGGLEIKAEEISIKENILMVGAAEVKMAASQVVEKLQVSPKSVELKEENEKAIYEMKVDEPRKLFGFIPLTIQNIMITDAAEGEILQEQRPWYAFFTTK